MNLGLANPTIRDSALLGSGDSVPSPVCRPGLVGLKVNSALVMRRSRVRIQKAAHGRPQDSLAVTWGFSLSMTLEFGPIGHVRSTHCDA
jgi:hypothetical protein